MSAGCRKRTTTHCIRSQTETEPSTRELRLDLLDGFRLARDGDAVILPHGVERLLAYVALTGESPRPEIARTLWPGTGDDQALACLRSTLWRLGRLCRGAVTTTPARVAISSHVTIDVRRYWAVAGALVDHAPLSAVDRHSFTDLMRAELLPGWYDDWVILERERLRQRGLRALEWLSARWLEQGAYASALDAALAAIAAEPLRESAYEAAARIHLAEGNLIQARRQYEACLQLLSDELGTEPSREFADLVYRRRLAQQARVQRSCGSREPVDRKARGWMW